MNKPPISVAFALLAATPFAHAVDLTSDIATLTIDSNTGAFTAWEVGVNHLALQEFYIGWDSVAEGSLGTKLGVPTIAQNELSNATITHEGSGFKVTNQVTLGYEPVGIDGATSGVTQNIEILNTSTETRVVRFFQYANFDLNQEPFDDFLAIELDAFFKVNKVIQSVDAVVSVVEELNNSSPLAVSFEAKDDGSTFAKLNDGSITSTLDETTPASNGDLSWVIQWEFTLLPDTGVDIVKGSLLNIEGVVPEPSTYALIAGLLTLAVAGLRRRR